MSETVNLPALGESVTEGTVTRWLKEVGDEVAVDEPLVEVSTDKVDTEIPSPVAGVLEEILVEEDDTVEVGAPLAKIGDGEGGGSSDASDDDASAEDASAEEETAEDESSDESEEKEEVKADTGSASGETTEVTLPALGESVTEGTITRWLKEVGDDVEVDEPLLEVSTDKVDTEIPSPVAGTLVEIKAQEDETVEVGAPLAKIGDGEGGGSSDASDDDASAEDASAEEETAEDESSDESEEKEEVKADTGSASGETTEVTLPALGESVTEGTITRWLKEVGDDVEVDEPLLEVSTDKVDTEIPSPVAGTLVEIKAQEDETVEVGAVLALVGDGSGSDSSDASDDDASAEDASAEEETAEDESSDESEEKEEVKADTGSASGETTEVTLPALGESVTEGTITRWLKEVGDDVEVDEPLLEVSTDKVDTEIPSPVAGTLVEIKAQEDETVEVGAVLALVGDGSGSDSSDDSDDDASAEEETAEAPAEKEEAPKQEEKAEEKAEAPKKQEEKAPAASAPKASASEPGQGYVTPLVRRMAKQHGVDLSTVRGTGVGGRIRKQDVLAASLAAGAASGSSAPAAETAAPAAAAAAPAAPVESSVNPSVRGNTEKAPRIRQVIAQRMRESLDLSTQLTQVHEVDLTRIVNLRGEAKASFQERHGVKLTYLPFIAQAVAEALKQHPKLNASFSADNKEITYHASEDIAVAVDTEKGLLVPVIKDAGSLNLSGIAQKIADVADRARTNKIGADELSGGTFSITNIGSVGALFDTPIINQPQVAILGTGAIVKRPMVVTDADGNDSIAVRHMMYLSLTYDHRLVDGADAGRFLMTLRQRLEAGEFAHELGL